MGFKIGKYSIDFDWQRLSIRKNVENPRWFVDLAAVRDTSGIRFVANIFTIDLFYRQVSILKWESSLFKRPSRQEMMVNYMWYSTLIYMGLIDPWKINPRKDAKKWVKRNLTEEQKKAFMQKLTAITGVL